jgi:hypothetical protein
MMVEITYPMVLSTLQTTGILVGIAYYIMTLNYTRRNQEMTLKTRSTTLFQQTLGALVNSSFGITNISLLNQYHPSSYEEHVELTNTIPEYRVAWLWISNMLDVAGIYLKEDVFDIGMFAKYNPWWFIDFWERYESIVDGWREVYGPSYMVYMEYLVTSLKNYTEEHPELLSP